MPFLRHILLASLAFYVAPSLAQKADSSAVKPTLHIGGYADAYAAYYTDSLGTGNFQKFPAISPRSNSFGLNIIQITEQYTSDRIRSTATLHYGDLPAAAWSPVFNFIQEANVGVRVAKNFWIDAGFFKTHIGTEALLPKDNITSSCSVITWYEPWWQSGVRFMYTPSDKFSGSLYIVNGYNQFVALNKKKALGLAISYNFSDKFGIAYNNLLSDNTDDTVSTPHWRFLHNLVFNIQATKKFKILLGGDFISQQNSGLSDSSKTAFVYSAILTLNYKFTDKWGIYGRYEMFSDADGFLTGTIVNTDGRVSGFKLMGYTLGLEYKPTENSYIRLEGRDLQMDPKQKIFYTNGAYTISRLEAMINMGIWF